MNKILDYIFDRFGERYSVKNYLGHGDYDEEGWWRLKIFKWEFTRRAW